MARQRTVRFHPDDFLDYEATLRRRKKRLARSRKRHYAWRSVKATARGVRWARRRGWARRRPLAPLYAAVVVFAIGVAAHRVEHGWRSVAILAGVTAVLIVGWQQLATTRTSWHRLTRNEWIWTGAVFTAVTTWLLWAAADGINGPPFGVLWVLILPPAWVTAALRYRIRQAPAEMPQTELQELWTAEAACADGVAPGSVMHTPEPLRADDPDLAVRARIELPRRSRVSVTSLIQSTERIAMLLDKPLTDVTLEIVNGLSPRWADLTQFNRNPLMETAYWRGPAEVFDPETGLAEIAGYVTGGQALYRFYRKSGPVHSLVSGTTDAGKSEFLNALLAIERAHPYMASIIIDPQQGQSLPDWRDRVSTFADSVEAGAVVMTAVVAEMYRRNAILSRVEWVDDKGRQRQGLSAYDINSPVIRSLNMPMLSITIEECGDALENETILACALKIATMGRKCGIKLRLVSQVPLLEQLKSTVLRDMLVGGNVVIFRTANALTGQVAFSGVLPADPHLLPREWPDGTTTAGICYVLGPNAKATIARTQLIEDIYHWSTIGETTTVPLLVAEAAELVAEAKDGVTPAARKTYVKLVQQHLAENVYATTGALADALGAPLSTISTTCRRLMDKGVLDKAGDGMWTLVRDEPAQAVA